MTVWIVSLEWNFPPSEVTGDTGIVGVFLTETAARQSQRETQEEFDQQGSAVYGYSYESGRYCIACGEQGTKGAADHACQNAFPADAEEFCDQCGAELGVNNTCDNDHDEWDIDVHCTEHTVVETAQPDQVAHV